MTILYSLLALALVLFFSAFLFTAWMARKVEALVPPSGEFVDVAGTRLHVRTFAGPPGAPALLLLHGLGGQVAHFTYGLTDLLCAHYRVVAVDRPGNGYSAPAAPDLAAQAALVASLIERLGLVRPLVVGHSLGGAVALALALDHPQHVAGLALLAPLTHTQETVPAVFRALTIESALLRRLVAWTVATPASIRNSRATLDQVFGPDPVPADFALRGGGLLGLRPATFLAASNDLLALRPRLAQQQARYPGLRLPLHVLYARGDRILDWRLHGQGLVDAVPGATLTLIEGGHMLPLTQPRACADLIAAVAAHAHVSGAAAVRA